MTICSGNYFFDHKEICYAEGDCPLCEAMDEIDELKKQLQDAKDDD